MDPKRTNRDRLLRVPATVALIACAACGDPTPRIGIEGAWARPTIAAGRTGRAPGEPSSLPSGPGVVYATVTNRGRAPDRLTAVRSEICESVEIHRTTLIEDRMRMAPVEGGIAVPAGGRATMRPGGYHVMLFGLRRHLREGDRFPIEFDFETSGSVSATVEVRAP